MRLEMYPAPVIERRAPRPCSWPDRISRTSFSSSFSSRGCQCWYAVCLPFRARTSLSA